LELEKEDDINEYGSYFMNTSSNPYSHENSWINWSPQYCHTWDLQPPHTSCS
jgi:hypothetical protein